MVVFRWQNREGWPVEYVSPNIGGLTGYPVEDLALRPSFQDASRHALHDLDPVFSVFSRGPELHALAQDAGLVEPQIWQSMYIFKQPGIGGEVRWHQDATYLHTRPSTVTGFFQSVRRATSRPLR